jgi:hypothetical protein
MLNHDLEALVLTVPFMTRQPRGLCRHVSAFASPPDPNLTVPKANATLQETSSPDIRASKLILVQTVPCRGGICEMTSA